MLPAASEPVGVTAGAFTTHCEQLYYSQEGGNAAPSTCAVADFPAFTAEELETVLAGRFNGAASAGMSPLPTQVVKHLAGKALEPLADFLTACTKHPQPPLAWRTAQLTPLYKGKGDRGVPGNYRALAVGHPLAKLASSMLNARLEKFSTSNGLRAAG